MSPSLSLLPTGRLVDATLWLFSVESRKQSLQRHAYIAGRAVIASHADVLELPTLSAPGHCVLTTVLTLH